MPVAFMCSRARPAIATSCFFFCSLGPVNYKVDCVGRIDKVFVDCSLYRETVEYFTLYATVVCVDTSVYATRIPIRRAKLSQACRHGETWAAGSIQRHERFPDLLERQRAHPGLAVIDAVGDQEVHRRE